MPVFSPDDLAAWSGGSWAGGPAPSVSRVSSDTRTLQPGDLYIALRGGRHDGHEFAEEAFRRGAAAAVVARDRAGGLAHLGPLLAVDETHRALRDIASGHRAQLGARMIAVAGSIGKTSVKEMTADILAQAGPVARTCGNWNNDIGLPLSLLRMEPEDRYGVFEVGMNHPGELAVLCDVLKPAWAVMTTVGPVHMEFFESVGAIAREKATVLESLPRDGLAVLSADDAWFDLFQGCTPCRIVTVSLKGEREADYAGVRNPEGNGSLTVRERATAETHVYAMPLPGGYVKENALRAIAVGREGGVPPEAIAQALRNYRPPAMRWNELTLDGIFFVNDAYNANPVSMREAIKTFGVVPVRGRRWLVLGGMRELGSLTESEHLALGREIAYGDWAGLVAVGELAAGIAQGASGEGWPDGRVIRCANPSEAARALRGLVAAGDAVLLKGSRAEHMEDVLSEWQSATGNRKSQIEN
ncbi:MAG: UDP-N-acetylmuramoyl-tripeptide--D-alanyl-D-alanine ligase [Kiritimatiellae bacterium]|nr:UDP-N-acetylmuramoyl-tripeptide--D-alanyl-D-alanine ligase [Kiritimatiellia bacterium]